VTYRNGFFCYPFDVKTLFAKPFAEVITGADLLRVDVRNDGPFQLYFHLGHIPGQAVNVQNSGPPTHRIFRARISIFRIRQLLPCLDTCAIDAIKVGL
jgi:hypothetical protein